jgi:hypothetical protein
MDPDGNGDLSDSDPDYDIGLAMLEDAIAVTEEIMTPRTPPVIVPPTLDRGKWISREGFQSYEICQAEGKDSIPTTLISGVGSDMKTLLKDAIVSVPKLNFLRFGNRSHAFTGDFDAPYSFGGRTVKFSPMPSPIRKLKEAMQERGSIFYGVDTVFSHASVARYDYQGQDHGRYRHNKRGHKKPRLPFHRDDEERSVK